MDIETLCSSYSITGDELRMNFPPDARATYTDHRIQTIEEEWDAANDEYLGYAIWTRKK